MNIILVGKLLHLTGCHTSIGHKCIKYIKGCKLWNNLPFDLKSITSNKLFNNKLKIFLRRLAHLINYFFHIP